MWQSQQRTAAYKLLYEAETSTQRSVNYCYATTTITTTTTDDDDDLRRCFESPGVTWLIPGP